MNILQLGKTIFENYFFMRSLTRHYGEPVRPSKEECLKIFDDLRNDRSMSHRFALLMDVKSLRLGEFSMNVENFLAIKGDLDLNKFFKNIHPDYVIDFIRWGQAVYAYSAELREHVKPMRQSSRITIPLKCKDGKYYWVLQEALPLQLDAQNNVLSHLNIYTIVRPMLDKEEKTLPLAGNLYDENFENETWTRSLLKYYFTRQPFMLTPEQTKIFKLLSEKPSLSNGEIAEQLKKERATIDSQNKDILKRARASFPNQNLENVREVVKF